MDKRAPHSIRWNCSLPVLGKKYWNTEQSHGIFCMSNGLRRKFSSAVFRSLLMQWSIITLHMFFFFHIKICPAATPLINYISTVVICTCSICGSEILFKQFWGIWSSTWTLKGRLPLYGYKYWHCHKKFYSSTSPESKHQSKLAIYIWGRKSEKYKDMILELRL